jgi:hypothetical protein
MYFEEHFNALFISLIGIVADTFKTYIIEITLITRYDLLKQFPFNVIKTFECVHIISIPISEMNKALKCSSKYIYYEYLMNR